MESGKAICVFGILFFVLAGIEASQLGGGLRKCGFPAVYNFGDSNSDTGGLSAALDEVPPPNGETFFGKPSGRFCDGRLIIDLIVENLGLPYLSAYLDSIGTNFRHGANFATGGSSILPGGYSPIHLDIQISQFIQFKSRTTALYKQLGDHSNLPRPRDFSKALYTFDIGQNDLAYGFEHTNEAHTRASIPTILDEFAQAVQQLYKKGARVFWVHNTGPIGCLPYNEIYYQPKPGNLDGNGCVVSQNEVAQEFNRQLKDRVSQLRAQLPHAAFTYVDVYSAKYTLISNAKNQGFENPMEFCCGSYYGEYIDCGKTAKVNGTIYGLPCHNPSRYISWDGIHYSQAANLLIAEVILNGSLSDLPISIREACQNPKNA
ncbi:unnamed protein product [Ilex paraguariensis]|uniref:Uncharacterized protein n=1 Tax=Ilex paraguariensis TaxID=185542 RepID=A0ABC8TIE3_9AQUA